MFFYKTIYRQLPDHLHHISKPILTNIYYEVYVTDAHKYLMYALKVTSVVT
jgi:hypothetical protein